MPSFASPRHSISTHEGFGVCERTTPEQDEGEERGTDAQEGATLGQRKVPRHQVYSTPPRRLVVRRVMPVTVAPSTAARPGGRSVDSADAELHRTAPAQVTQQEAAKRAKRTECTAAAGAGIGDR